MGLWQLLWTLAWSGAPITLMAMVLQGIWLHQFGRFSLPAVVATAGFSAILSLLAGLVLWGRVFAGSNIMAWEVINLPAVLACVLVFPAVGLLVRFGFDAERGR